jgi:hypothetical protein
MAEAGGSAAGMSDHNLPAAGMLNQVRANFSYYNRCPFRRVVVEIKILREPPRLSAGLRNLTRIVDTSDERRHPLQPFPSQNCYASAPANYGIDFELVGEPFRAS